MERRERVLLVLAAVALLVWWGTAAAESPELEDTSSLGPLEPVGPIGNTNPVPGVDYNADTAALCRCAPLNSFGPACEGYTWASLPAAVWLGTWRPVDFRDVMPYGCNQGRQ